MPWFGWLASIVSGRRCARRSCCAHCVRLQQPNAGSVGPAGLWEIAPKDTVTIINLSFTSQERRPRTTPAPGLGPPLSQLHRVDLCPIRPVHLPTPSWRCCVLARGEGEVACARLGKAVRACAHQSSCGALQVPGKHQGFVHIKTCRPSHLPHTPPCIRNRVRMHGARARFPFARVPVTSSR